MANETLLRALQERMRKLNGRSGEIVARIAKLQATLGEARSAAEAAVEHEASAVKDTENLAKEVKTLQDHINSLVRNKEDAALITALQDELGELETKQRESEQQVERLKSRSAALKQSLENTANELKSAEQDHRVAADQAMKLREHIEKVSHG